VGRRATTRRIGHGARRRVSNIGRRRRARPTRGGRISAAARGR
jgi:hypothetical protein